MIKSINSINEFNELLNDKLTLLYIFPEKTNISFYETLEILNTIYKNKINCFLLKIPNQNPIIKIYRNKKFINLVNSSNLNSLNKIIIKNIY